MKPGWWKDKHAQTVRERAQPSPQSLGLQPHLEPCISCQVGRHCQGRMCKGCPGCPTAKELQRIFERDAAREPESHSQ